MNANMIRIGVMLGFSLLVARFGKRNSLSTQSELPAVHYFSWFSICWKFISNWNSEYEVIA